MKRLEIRGHGDDDGFNVAVTKDTGEELTTDEWNTAVNALRLRHREKEIIDGITQRKGFIYAFPLAFGE